MRLIVSQKEGGPLQGIHVNASRSGLKRFLGTLPLKTPAKGIPLLQKLYLKDLNGVRHTVKVHAVVFNDGVAWDVVSGFHPATSDFNAIWKRVPKRALNGEVK